MCEASSVPDSQEQIAIKQGAQTNKEESPKLHLRRDDTVTQRPDEYGRRSRRPRPGQLNQVVPNPGGCHVPKQKDLIRRGEASWPTGK